MSFTKLSKGSILYIEAKDLLSMPVGSTGFMYPGATTNTSAGGQNYTQSVASRNKLTESSATSLIFRRVSEHNRSEFNIGTNRIEKSSRMANGSLRKYFVADKKIFSVSWSMLPSFRNETVDGGWAAEDLKTFYESELGQGVFRIRINPSGWNPESIIESNDYGLQDDYTYTVSFTSCDFTVVKRGIQSFWNVNLSMEQV
jgi:hypothetical protein